MKLPRMPKFFNDASRNIYHDSDQSPPFKVTTLSFFSRPTSTRQITPGCILSALASIREAPVRFFHPVNSISRVWLM